MQHLKSVENATIDPSLDPSIDPSIDRWINRWIDCSIIHRLSMLDTAKQQMVFYGQPRLPGRTPSTQRSPASKRCPAGPGESMHHFHTQQTLAFHVRPRMTPALVWVASNGSSLCLARLIAR
eukprot:gene18623-biopygen9964